VTGVFLVVWTTGSSVEILVFLLSVEHFLMLVAPVNLADPASAMSSNDQHLHGVGRFAARRVAFKMPTTGRVCHAPFSVSPRWCFPVKCPSTLNREGEFITSFTLADYGLRPFGQSVTVRCPYVTSCSSSLGWNDSLSAFSSRVRLRQRARTPVDGSNTWR
jgi:hypothetical protein